MFASWEDSFGNFDVRRATGMSKKQLKSCFLDALAQHQKLRGQSLFTLMALKDMAAQKGLLEQIADFKSFVDELNEAGFLTRAAGGTGGPVQYEYRG